MRTKLVGAALSFGLFAAMIVVAPASGQTAPLKSHLAPVHVDSGPVENVGRQPAVVFSTTLHVPEATWLRLNFDDVQLSGSIAAGTGSYLMITSLLDGHYQYLNAVHVRQWQNTSAYFNGDAVLIEIVAHPGTGVNRLVMSQVVAGEGASEGDRSICGPTDDRVLSYDRRAGRLQPGGCTGWIIDDCMHCMLTAGHCSSSNNVIQFNVPLSNANGSLNHPGPEHQYSFDPASMQSNGGQGVGNDWAYFGCFPNSNTGLTAYEAQGLCFSVVMPPAVGNNNIRITGYGTVSSPVSPTWNQVQKTHVGPFTTSSGTTLGYRADTTGGNSGSPVIWEEVGKAIGIHTHGGCTSTGGENNGTGANHTGLQAALASPKGVCVCSVGLKVTPTTGLNSYGYPGGPFTPASIDYILKNVGKTTFSYTVTKTQPWLSITDATGTLTVGQEAIVTVSLNANASSLPAGIHTDTLTFTNTTNHLGDTTRPVKLHIGGYNKLYSWYLDTNPGWVITGGQWAFGQPTGQGGTQYGYPDPSSGFTGANVYGVNLNGDYATTPGGPWYLRLGPVDLSNAVAGVTLRFKRWLNTDHQPYVYATIDVSKDGTNWVAVWDNGATEIAENYWSTEQYDITAPAAEQSNVYVRWGYKVGSGAWVYSGWNIDDIEIWGITAQPPPHPGDLNCDGVVDFNDVNPFVLALDGQAAYQAQYPNCRWLNADCNNDGLVNFDDINPFVALLSP